MNNIAVFGLGKVGSLVAHLLSKQFSVIGVDLHEPEDKDVAFIYRKVDVGNELEIKKLLQEVDAVVSCLTYQLEKRVAALCIENGVHFFNLTEDVPTTTFIQQEVKKYNKSVAIPQCGLAPGFVGIVGFDLTKKFTRLRDVELRVGALPQYPNGLLGYSFTWSPMGVVNEYLNDAEVIHNGKRRMVTSLDGLEHIQLEGQEFEAFSTSGGLGTLCQTLDGKVDTLNYKTMRYPGHAQLMRFLMYELIMKKDRETLVRILTEAKPPVQKDVVYVYAVVEGWKGESLAREEFLRTYKPITIDGKEWRAISWTTAASIVSVVSLVAEGKIPQTGFVKQEDIALDLFLSTPTGSLYK